MSSTTGRFLYYYKIPLGTLGFIDENDALTHILFPNSVIPDGAVIRETPLIRQAFAEISEYLSGDRETFDLPLAPKGTPFQEKVWQALQTIPYGQTISYQELARRVGKPTAARAVGMANHHNPLPIVIPCHRVVGKNGSLTGYAGGLDLKRYLLALESRQHILL